jgi:hypothetical protein
LEKVIIRFTTKLLKVPFGLVIVTPSTMKKLSAATLLFFTLTLAANAEIFEEISQGIRSGDVRMLSKNFNSSIDLTIASQENTYSKAQAEQVLRDFFSTNKPVTFNIIHQGLSKEGAKYAIGQLSTSSGKSFRVYLYVKQVGNAYLVNELRFMEE